MLFFLFLWNTKNTRHNIISKPHSKHLLFKKPFWAASFGVVFLCVVFLGFTLHSIPKKTAYLLNN